MSETRSQEHTVEIHAPIEAVWKALTDAGELTRWYVERAEIDLREGGRYWISFGEGMDGAAEIEVVEPGRRLRLRRSFVADDPAGTRTPAVIVQDWRLESRHGITVLHLVHSGVPTAEDWDAYYTGTDRGWRFYFLAIRHYLERHAGRGRDHVMFMLPAPGSREDLWDRLTGPGGLGLEEEPGERYRARSAAGDLRGGVLILEAPTSLVLSVESLDEALLAVMFEEMQGQTFLYFSLSLYGMDPDRVEALRSEWSGFVTRLLGETAS